MKHQIIAKAAHDNSGVSELNARGAGVLTSAKAKISTVLALLLLPFLSFGDYNLVDSRRYSYNGVGTTTYGTLVVKAFSPSTKGFEDAIFSATYNKVVGFSCTLLAAGTPSPNVYYKSSTSQSIDYPFKVYTNETSFVYFDWGSCAPNTYALYSMLSRLYLSGYRHYENIYTNANVAFVNFIPSRVVSDVIAGTNTPWRATVLSALSQINMSVQGISTGIQNIHVDVGQLQTDYQTVNGAALDYQNAGYSQLPDPIGNSAFGSRVLDILNNSPWTDGQKSQLAQSLAKSYSDYLFEGAQLWAEQQNDPNSPAYGKTLEEMTTGNGVQAMRGYSYSTPLTNGMQRMTTDWKNAVTNDLAKNTASITNRLAQNTVSITNQLAQWKRDLHNDIIDGVSSPLSSVITDDGGQNSVRVNANIVGGQMTVNGGSIEVGDLSIGRITDGMDGIQGAIQQALSDWLDEWYDWAYRNPDSWSEFYRRFYAEFGPEVVTNQERQISLLVGVTNALYTSAWTNELVSIISNGVAGLDLSITNELWDYYFDRFRKANEFKDDGGLPYSLDLVRQQVFGSGFDESRYRELDWFSRVELLLYQIGYAETNEVPEVADIQTELEDVAETVSTHAEDFVATSVKVVSVFNLLRRFADSVKLAFTPANGELVPVTSGIVLLQGGSWLVNEPLVLNVPVPIQNALRLVFQCIWYLSAFVIGWRVFSSAWERIVSVVRWIWSVFDV